MQTEDAGLKVRRYMGCENETYRGGEIMSFTLQQKKALYWGVGILTLFALANLAWAQIAKAIGSFCLRS